MATNIFIDEYRDDVEKAFDFLRDELAKIRTGRANTSLLEEVTVDAYGAKQMLKNVASLSVPESSTIAIQPWDKGVIKDIEAALKAAHLGLEIINLGEKILAKVPMLTEETRKEMVKLLGKKTEETRIAVRKIRDEIKEKIISSEKAKEIGEDDKYQYLGELDEFIQDINKRIEAAREEKEAELMRV